MDTYKCEISLFHISDLYEESELLLKAKAAALWESFKGWYVKFRFQSQIGLVKSWLLLWLAE